MSDQAGGSPSKTESQLTYNHCDTVPRAMNHCRLEGGVSLSHSKADSCPDRLASMVQELELHEYTGESTMMLPKPLSNMSLASTECPQSLVTPTSDINNFSSTPKSSVVENVEHHPMGDGSTSTSTTLEKHTDGISPENAQSIYPPEACVFVAK